MPRSENLLIVNIPSEVSDPPVPEGSLFDTMSPAGDISIKL